jgi:hypothetical protein
MERVIQMFFLGLEMWTLRNYSTVTSMCGLFLDVIVVGLFALANSVLPLMFAAHYFTFPFLPVYLPSVFPYNLGNTDIVYYGFAVIAIVGVSIFNNVALSAAVLCCMCLGESD